MNTQLALECLKRYTKKNIRDVNVKTSTDDYGVRGLILFCQERYDYDLGLVKFSEVEGFQPPPVNSIRDALFQSYDYDSFEYLSDRKYVSDILLNKNFDTDFYVNSINRLTEKMVSVGLDLEEKYELTHLCWSLYMIGVDNHILRNYKDLMSKALITVYLSSPNTDVGTESLYFLTLISPDMIKEDWIMSLEQSQEENGCFRGITELQQTHHTALVLLTLWNYYQEN
tara:strand:- start:389 stop:1069 length:681 start_codon:yes stop_codon:yes gene_type:complete